MPGRTTKWRLRDITLHCQSGERIGIIGSNGAGKSSLARILCGLDRPGKGQIRRQPGRARVMLLLQRPEEHFLAKTVRQEVAGYAPKPLEEDEAAHLLRAVGLDARLIERAPRTLSSGQQRALSLACGLATQPALLILDEPMAGLDAPSREHVIQSLKTLSLAEHVALCVISHHPDDLLGWAERLWALEDGKLVYDGPFRSIPVEILEGCMDTSTPSLFYALRRLEESGYEIDPIIYQQRSARAIAELLERGRAR